MTGRAPYECPDCGEESETPELGIHFCGKCGHKFTDSGYVFGRDN